MSVGVDIILWNLRELERGRIHESYTSSDHHVKISRV